MGKVGAALWPDPELTVLFPELGPLLAARAAPGASSGSSGPAHPRLPGREGRRRHTRGALEATAFPSEHLGRAWPTLSHVLG